ncbi:MAG TPA: RsmE family RNA methyltransferase [Tepidisphaeraceae bacterium]
MIRRLHATRLFIGKVPLDPSQARHARDVLRLQNGAEVEVFDDHGAVASGLILLAEDNAVAVEVKHIAELAGPSTGRITVASAIPKGERADWMVEKLSELGVDAFIPLAAERSVTLPQGTTKFERWNRISTESAKQSRRRGVMAIGKLTSLNDFLEESNPGYVLSTASEVRPLTDVLVERREAVVLAIGPEGGWTEQELTRFAAKGHQQVSLTSTILRTETAAIAAATVAVLWAGRHSLAK